MDGTYEPAKTFALWGAAFLAEVECPYCHRRQQNVPCMTYFEGLRKRAVALELYDLDEGDQAMHKEAR